jgi:hypothetical protein
MTLKDSWIPETGMQAREFPTDVGIYFMGLQEQERPLSPKL